jgi:hypothetical protein
MQVQRNRLPCTQVVGLIAVEGSRYAAQTRQCGAHRQKRIRSGFFAQKRQQATVVDAEGMLPEGQNVDGFARKAAEGCKGSHEPPWEGVNGGVKSGHAAA